jgi:hypothetical protein
MANYYFKEFEDYIKLLCVKHKALLHVDGEHRSFVRFQSNEDIESIPVDAGSSIVVVDQFSGKAVGEFDDHKLQQHVSLLFLVRTDVNADNPYSAIQAALAKAWGILFDFYARMKQDMLDDDCGPLKHLQAEQMNFSPVDGPVLESHYGWEMTIAFKVNAPAFDASKWNP